jgi:hypothetical protein
MTRLHGCGAPRYVGSEGGAGVENVGDFAQLPADVAGRADPGAAYRAGRILIALDPATIHEIAAQTAARIVEVMCTGAPRGLVDAQTVARALGVSRDTVYAHREQLGGHRVGDGARGRLRFDLNYALAAWTSRSTSKESQPPRSPGSAGRTQRRRRPQTGSSPELLPIRGSATQFQAPEGRSC